MTEIDAPTQMIPVPPPAVPRPRVRIARLDPEHASHLIAAALGTWGLVWIVYERVLPLAGGIGFWLIAYATFLGLYAALTATALDRVAVVDRIVGALVTTSATILVAILAGIVGFTVVRGWSAITHLNFYTQTTAYIGPDANLDKGGIYAAIIGTLEQVTIATVVSVPLGIATAVYLNEVRGRSARLVRTVVESMSSIPTIVAGLFIYSLLIIQLGWERSGFAASLALCVSMLPVVTTTAELVLRLVPGGLREASLALGMTQWQTVRGVVLPTARSGLVTAVLLGVARVIGETSPVLLVAGSTNELNYDAFHGPQVSLPLFVFNEVRLPLDQAIARAFGSGVVLLLLVVVIFSVARIIGGRPPGRLSRRQRRALTLKRPVSPEGSIPA
ncbi:MAG: phosphate transporter permease PtsA [Aeromicrobium sp.]|nr:phosphate transporter permease PtsA [Aeromicrobium sp.]